MALPFIAVCATVNALTLRSYPRLNKREASLALMDIFGAPYADYHSFTEWQIGIKPKALRRFGPVMMDAVALACTADLLPPDPERIERLISSLYQLWNREGMVNVHPRANYSGGCGRYTYPRR